MDLNKIFKLLQEKDLHYIEAHLNSGGYINLFCSSGYNGRGRYIEIDSDMSKEDIVNKINLA